MAYLIEKKAPPPPPVRRGGRRGRKPGSIADTLHAMEVGDAVTFPGKSRNIINSRVAGVSKRTGAKFTSRTVPEGARVWRIA
jgi:hypothetical protein